MSVIIKGMKMPATCGKCSFSETEYKGLDEFCVAMNRENVTKYANNNKGRHPQCPLIDIPKKHGRLIVKTEEGEEIEIN